MSDITRLPLVARVLDPHLIETAAANAEAADRARMAAETAAERAAAEITPIAEAAVEAAQAALSGAQTAIDTAVNAAVGGVQPYLDGAVASIAQSTDTAAGMAQAAEAARDAAQATLSGAQAAIDTAVNEAVGGVQPYLDGAVASIAQSTDTAAGMAQAAELALQSAQTARDAAQAAAETAAERAAAELAPLTTAAVEAAQTALGVAVDDAVGTVQTYLDGAVASTSQAAGTAADMAQAAEVAQQNAQAARDAAFVAADVYPTIAAGLSGTSSGQQFQIVDGVYLVRYRNAGPEAVEVSRLRNGASLTAVDNTADTEKPVSAPQRAALLRSEAHSAYRASLDRFLGDLPPGAAPPVVVDGDGRVLVAAGGGTDTAAIWTYRQSLASFIGDLPLGSSPPLLVDGTDHVVVGAGVSGSEGTSGTARTLPIWSNSGQSNAVGAVDGPAELVYPHQGQELLVLARGAIADQWTGLESGGGASYQLDAGSITGITPMQVIPSTRGHGTTAGEAAARAAIAQGRGPILLWSTAEGGQTIANLMPDAPSGYHAFANYVKMLTRAQALKPAGARLLHAWTFCQQGESNTSATDLGALHNALRAAYEAQARAILGQTEALRMIDWQASSFNSASDGVRSILAEALSQRDAAAFICGGPTYGFPFKVEGHEGEAAYLHNSSLGHAMRGELGAAIVRRVEADGFYLPLHAVSAAITGANTITVRMSEAVEVATNDVVSAIANHGLTLTGGAISAVAVSGETITITTAAAASGVTAVNIGLTGQSSPRTEARIPRTNLRALRPLGTYSWGGLIRAWACHQSLALT